MVYCLWACCVEPNALQLPFASARHGIAGLSPGRQLLARVYALDGPVLAVAPLGPFF